MEPPNLLLRLYARFQEEGNVSRATQCIGLATSLLHESTGDDAPRTLAARVDFALLSLNNGDNDAAIGHLDSVLESYLSFYGVDEILLSVLYVLGSVCEQSGKYNDAIEYYRRSLETCLKLYGPIHATTANALNNLGNVFKAVDNAEDAIVYFNRALATYEAVFQIDHIDAADTISNLGSVFACLGNYDEAIIYYERALKSIDKYLGPRHVKSANTVNNMASVFWCQGRVTAALDLYLRSLDVCRAADGTAGDIQIPTLYNLSCLQHSMGDFKVAAEYYRNASVKLRTRFGNQDITIATLLKGETRYALSETSNESPDLSVKTLQPNDPRTEVASHLIAEVINKTIEIGYHFVNNSRLYIEEVRKYCRDIELQIPIWQAVSRLLGDERIKQRIRDVDLIRFAKVLAELHRLMEKFVAVKCMNKEERKKILEAHSVNELIEKLEKLERTIFENLPRAEMEQRFWNSLRQEVAYQILKQSREMKFVTEIVFWGTKLDRFSAAVFPSMFPTMDRENLEKFGNLFASRHLKELNSIAQVMLVQSVDSTITQVGDLALDEAGDFNLEGVAQITLIEGIAGEFIRPPSPDPDTEQDVAREHANRTDLGGKERRQWGTFTKYGKTSTVIVEFKAKPSSDDARYFLPPEFLYGEVKKLIRTLRVASKLKEADSENRPFHLLFPEGWYDRHDHFGLVYRLPLLKTTNFRCESLGNILLKEEFRRLLANDLGNRIVLAKALAQTLFELHSVNWVHESFHPDNILLFAEEYEPDVYLFDWSLPYVVGFDSARSDMGRSGKFNPKALWTSRIYTHPDRDETRAYKRFKKTYDIYALGVVLLEVGRLRSFIDEVMEQQKVMKEFHLKEKLKEDPDAMQVDSEPVVEFTYKTTPHDFKNIFEKKTEVLNEVLGPAYRVVVMRCLNWQVVDAADENTLSGLFRSEVCDRLDLIKF